MDIPLWIAGIRAGRLDLSHQGSMVPLVLHLMVNEMISFQADLK
jgi:hypothetical protein